MEAKRAARLKNKFDSRGKKVEEHGRSSRYRRLSPHQTDRGCSARAPCHRRHLACATTAPSKCLQLFVITCEDHVGILEPCLPPSPSPSTRSPSSTFYSHRWASKVPNACRKRTGVQARQYIRFKLVKLPSITLRACKQRLNKWAAEEWWRGGSRSWAAKTECVFRPRHCNSQICDDVIMQWCNIDRLILIKRWYPAWWAPTCCYWTMVTSRRDCGVCAWLPEWSLWVLQANLTSRTKSVCPTSLYHNIRRLSKSYARASE